MSREAVLLLGGNGFIGSALASRLRQDKVPVFAVGRQNEETLAKVLPECGTVVHLASTTTPGSSAQRSALELPNLSLTLRLLDLLQAHRDIHLIFFSSGGTVYGNPARLPVAEDAPIAPLSNHGAGKAAQEAFCEAFRARGHAVTILRPANAYGPGQNIRQGFGLIRTLLEHALQGRQLEIWGDGSNVRDYVYIDDVVETTMRLIALPSDSGTYNLGSGKGHSINQVLEIAETICGRPINALRSPPRSVDVQSIVLDIERLSTRLNWHPSVELTQGMILTAEWLKST